MNIISICAGDIMRYVKAEGGKSRTIDVSTKEYRFVVIDDKFIIGDISQHISLVAIYDLGCTPQLISAYDTSGAKPSAEVYLKIIQKYKSKIMAAGIIDGQTGVVEEWESIGFGVTTPVTMRKELQQHISTLLPHNGWINKNWP